MIVRRHVGVANDEVIEEVVAVKGDDGREANQIDAHLAGPAFDALEGAPGAGIRIHVGFLGISVVEGVGRPLAGPILSRTQRARKRLYTRIRPRARTPPIVSSITSEVEAVRPGSKD